MTEPQPVVRPRKRSYRYLYHIVFVLLFFPWLVVIAARLTGIWPYTVLGSIAAGVPLLLGVVRSWNRWSHPERLPMRWPNGYRLGERLQILETALFWIWFVGCVTLFIKRSAHNRSYAMLFVIVIAAGAWDGFLTKYIADRKYIPPPPPYVPPTRTTYKPLQSEHWGERGTPNPGRPEA
jgi:hypothetical protein